MPEETPRSAKQLKPAFEQALLRCVFPSSHTGVIIGRNGTNMARIRGQCTGARIKVGLYCSVSRAIDILPPQFN